MKKFASSGLVNMGSDEKRGSWLGVTRLHGFGSWLLGLPLVKNGRAKVAGLNDPGVT